MSNVCKIISLIKFTILQPLSPCSDNHVDCCHLCLIFCLDSSCPRTLVLSSDVLLSGTIVIGHNVTYHVLNICQIANEMPQWYQSDAVAH